MAVVLRLGEARLQSEHFIPQCAACDITSAVGDQDCRTGGISVESCVAFGFSFLSIFVLVF